MSSEKTRNRPTADEAEDSTQKTCTPWLLISCLVLSFTTAFVFGWGLAAPNMYNSHTEIFLQNQNPCDSSAIKNDAENSPKTEGFDFVNELVKGIPQTVFLIGAFIGALTGPMWVSALDRKRTVFANYIFTFGSSLCMLVSYYKNMTSLFYISRFLLGYQG